MPKEVQKDFVNRARRAAANRQELRQKLKGVEEEIKFYHDLKQAEEARHPTLVEKPDFGRVRVAADKIKEMETKIKEMKTKIKEMKTELKEMKTELEEEESQLKEIKAVEVKEDIARKEDQIKALKAEIARKEDQIKEVKPEIKALKEEIKEVKAEIKVLGAEAGELLVCLLTIDRLERREKELVQKKEALCTEISEAPPVAPLQSYRRGVNPFVHPDAVDSGRFLKGKLNARQYDVVDVTLDVMDTYLLPLPLGEEVADNLIPTESIFKKCHGELGQGKHAYGGILGLAMARSVEAPLSIRSERRATLVFGIEDVDQLNRVQLVPDFAIAYERGDKSILAFVVEAKRAGDADMGKALMLVSDVLCNMHDAEAANAGAANAGAADAGAADAGAANAGAADAGAADAGAANAGAANAGAANADADAAALKAFGAYVGGPNLTVICASFKDSTKSGSELSKTDNIKFVKTVFDMKNKESAKDASELLMRIYAHVQKFWSNRCPGSSQIPTDAVEFTATSMKPDLGGQNNAGPEENREGGDTEKGDTEEKDTRNGKRESKTGPNDETVDGVLTMCEANDAALYARGVDVDLGVRHLVCDDAQPADALADMNAHRRLRTGTWRHTRVFIKELVHEECGGEPHELTVLKRLRGTRGVIGVCATVRLPYLHRTALLTPLHCVLARHWRLEKADAGTWEWLAALFDQAAAALLAALARGVAHGDVKPANMVVTARDELLLIDFDVAMIGEPGGPLLTTSRAGTRGYLAPEKCAAAHMHDAVAADVFSLGASFRKLLAAMPGGKRTKTRQRLDEMLARMVAEAPGDRPTLAEVREWR